MSVTELKTFLPQCDWRDTEGGRCPVMGQEIKVFDMVEAHEEMNRRGWAIVPNQDSLVPYFKHYCTWHSSEGKPYPPMEPSRRVPPPSMTEREEDS